MSYLTPDDPDAFLDYPEKPTPELSIGLVECPVCHKHGGWNLRVNSRKLHEGVADTPENRHKYVHFRAYCNQCYGRGWTTVENAKCVHTMEFSRNLGRCYNEYKCSKCGKIENVDSSD